MNTETLNKLSKESRERVINIEGQLREIDLQKQEIDHKIIESIKIEEGIL